MFQLFTIFGIYFLVDPDILYMIPECQTLEFINKARNKRKMFDILYSFMQPSLVYSACLEPVEIFSHIHQSQTGIMMSLLCSRIVSLCHSSTVASLYHASKYCKKSRQCLGETALFIA